MTEQAKTVLSADKKSEYLDFMQLLENLDPDEQKIMFGFIQGIKLLKSSEKAAESIAV